MSTRGRKKPPALTPEESLYLDGRLPPDEARELEHRLAADPERAGALRAYQEAMDLWRDDAERGAQALPAETVADRVLAQITERPVESKARRTVDTFWYAAAAVLLIALGLGGTFMSRSTESAPRMDAADVDLRMDAVNSVVTQLALEDR